MSEGSVFNETSARRYRVSRPPFIFNDVQEGEVYKFAVVVVTEDGYRSMLSVVVSRELLPTGMLFYVLLLPLNKKLN